MDDLITFLRACLDDDERVARKCAPGPWVIQGEPRESYVVSAAGVAVALGWLRDAEHIARWDPARVLAEIDAKRRIIDAIYDRKTWRSDPPAQFIDLDLESRTLELLALPYADREGRLHHVSRRRPTDADVVVFVHSGTRPVAGGT